MVSRAPAEKVTGEDTVAPLAGEHILTVLSTVVVHAAEATFAEARRKVAARRVRSEIIRGPVSETKLPAKCHGQAKSVDVARRRRPTLFLQLGEHPLFQGCPRNFT